MFDCFIGLTSYLLVSLTVYSKWALESVSAVAAKSKADPTDEVRTMMMMRCLRCVLGIEMKRG